MHNGGPFTYTLQRLTVPWSQNSIKLYAVQFGSATLWSTNPSQGDTDNQGGSSWGPSAPAEMIWSPSAPDFTFPAGPGLDYNLTLTWNGNINAINDPTQAVFINDQTGTTCSIQLIFN